ncbi:pupal cuticle protein Edg-78E-like [Drosophila sulfurigaster albostrigata]|uniref:pupal cuticle protein Edg-78E-like n=1 Tax=Drosophila sulfurigaster albostrigata TaxID=89887 RepID=UPI002D2192A1|nr:pupal cuticle protein Edg-78E-like [Drosophila sulfurigaster albostrigata]
MCKISLIVAALCLVACCYAADESDAVVTKYTSQINEDGTYGYEYGTSNNIQGQESGVGGAYAQGSYSYIAPDGQPIQIEYKADQNGYQPKGDHLPTPPPIPDYILRALEYIETHPFPRIQLKK